LCLHGNGGLGKTTALQLIAAELPERSVTCCGDGLKATTVTVDSIAPTVLAMGPAA
jgi:Holliday junction resolvasome RuvABC ATP-dependent DNA helicase subunit